MSWILIVEQSLNGLQFGLMLFLLAAGLTLVFGIMDMINLAHGSLYMLGAFLASTFVALTGSFTAGVLLAIPATAVLGMLLEITVLRTLYARDHLSQVLATFALILILNEVVRLVWGPDAALAMPAALSGPVELLPGLQYPAYRLVMQGVHPQFLGSEGLGGHRTPFDDDRVLGKVGAVAIHPVREQVRPLGGDVLDEGTAHGDIHHLQAAADAGGGQLPFGQRSGQGDLELVSHRVDPIDGRMGLAPIAGGIDVPAPRHDHPIEAAEQGRDLAGIAGREEHRDAPSVPNHLGVVAPQGVHQVVPGGGMEGAQAGGDADQWRHW